LQIGIIISTLDLLRGGLETMARGLARELADRGHSVTTIAGSWFGSRLEHAPGIEQLRVPCVPLNLNLLQVVGRFRPGWPLEIQSRTFINACRVRPSVHRRILELPLTMTFLEAETIAIARWRMEVGRLNISFFPGPIRAGRLPLDRSALRLATSRTLTQLCARTNPDIRIDDVLYPGVEVDPHPVRAVPETAYRIVYVGRLEPNKGIDMLLTLAREMARRRMALELRLIGAGPMEEQVQNARIDIESQSQVRIVCTGALAAGAVRAELANTDMFVFPSRYESFGIAVLEAMACGVPVLCSDLPALREVADDVAIYVGADDAAAWIESTIRLIQDPAARATMSRRGVERARDFSWGAAVDRLEAHARRLLSRSQISTVG
jgi:glycosyltransferase involved in cell wall biosynthesis